MIFHSFSSSLSIRDELVESSSDSCNILPETVTVHQPQGMITVLGHTIECGRMERLRLCVSYNPRHEAGSGRRYRMRVAWNKSTLDTHPESSDFHRRYAMLDGWEPLAWEEAQRISSHCLITRKSRRVRAAPVQPSRPGAGSFEIQNLVVACQPMSGSTHVSACISPDH
jgi:hypothetical protein